MSFQSGDLRKVLKIKGKSGNLSYSLAQKRSGFDISLLLFHNQKTYSLNNNDWLIWLFGLEIYFSVSRLVAVVNVPYIHIMEFQKIIWEKSGNFVSMKNWEICIWKTMPDSWTIRPTMKQNV